MVRSGAKRRVSNHGARDASGITSAALVLRDALARKSALADLRASAPQDEGGLMLVLAGPSNHIFRMAREYKVGDHVSWNSEAGRVRGRVTRVHRKNVNWKGYVHRA